MVKKFSQNFIVYHGCGSCYYDGTNRIVAKNRRCINPTYNPFWKKTNDVRNKFETRAQLKLKSIVTESYIKTYLKFINEFNKKGYFSSENESTDDESTDDEWINEKSLNDSKTDAKLKTEQSNTGEDLLIDENINTNNIRQTETVSDVQNPNTEN